MTFILPSFGASAIAAVPGGGVAWDGNTYSVDFDGTDDYLDISGIATSINSLTTVSWSGWYKGTDTSGYIFRASPAGVANPHIGMSINSNTLYSTIHNGSTVIYGNHGTSINDGNWHHLAVTYNGSSGVAKSYVDGSTGVALSGTAPPNVGTGYTASNIGRRPHSSHLYTDGLIDEFAIWFSELSASQITNIYRGETDGGSGGTNGLPGDLSSFSPVGWYRMGDNDNGAGTTITDQGSGGNDGTLINSPTFSTTVPS